MSKCEKRCEDCIHCDLCLKIDRLTLFDKNQPAHCKAFKDKSLFVELPCKVGDKVFVDENTWGWMLTSYENRFIHSKYFLVGEVVSIIKTKKQLLMKIRVSNSIHTRYRHKRYPVSAIGKTVFLTKEEAEKELERNAKNN